MGEQTQTPHLSLWGVGSLPTLPRAVPDLWSQVPSGSDFLGESLCERDHQDPGKFPVWRGAGEGSGRRGTGGEDEAPRNTEPARLPRGVQPRGLESPPRLLPLPAGAPPELRPAPGTLVGTGLSNRTGPSGGQYVPSRGSWKWLQGSLQGAQGHSDRVGRSGMPGDRGQTGLQRPSGCHRGKGRHWGRERHKQALRRGKDRNALRTHRT